MAKAYGELEKKLGSSQQAQSSEEPVDSTTANLEDLVEQATRTFVQDGEIPNEILEAFQERGIPPSYVSELVEGRKNRADSYTKELFDTVGGEDQWKEISQWASQNLSEEDRNAFNAAVNSGDTGAARLAVYGVQARYNSAVRDPRNDLNLQGNQAGQNGPAGYRTQEEYLSDLQNPKYTTDEAYRQSVQLRLRATAPSVIENL
jgi:hypothetical protein